MASTFERRHDNPERVPLNMAVELGDGDFRDPFAASVCNVSKGGISMRATCLPDVGSKLMCRFRCMPSNTLVTVQGEIVWAHLDGENCGEFGLAFVDLDPKTEWLIEEMIAEHAALSRAEEPSAPVATLELEGSAAPIEARLSHKAGGRAVFEQELDLLKLGRGGRAPADGRDLLAGSIASVELKMVGAVPMLAVTVAFQHGAEVALGGQIELPVHEHEHDTEPDLMAPPELEAAAEQAALDEVLGVEPVHAAPPAPAEPAAPALPAAVLPAPAPAPRVETRAESQSVSFRTARAEALDAEDPDFEAELEAVRASVWKPIVLAVLQRAQAALAALRARLRPALGALLRAALPVIRGTALRSASRTRAAYRAQVAPQLGALRRVVSSQLLGRKRRVTAGPAAHAPRARTPMGRTLVLGVLAATAVGLGVYALAPNAGDDAVDMHRKVRGKRAHDTPASAEAAAAAEAPGGAPPAAAQNDVGAMPAQPAPSAAASAAPKATAPAATLAGVAVPAAAAATAIAADTKSASAPAPRKLRFGAARVPGGRQFSLRMSAPIRSIEGSADRGGFTIVVSGALSLDRAGPIASAHKSVSRAMVINKGDHAELSVRFSDGKQPAFSVNAEGNTLYITIQDA
jgi:hypothetical protein